jgi:hypothetical protein
LNARGDGNPAKVNVQDEKGKRYNWWLTSRLNDWTNGGKIDNAERSD